jgi:uncharacterized damage-inducible protein DinB
MEKNVRQGAIGALLGEYEKAIKELQHVIENISATDLATVVDNITADANCKSIQTILTHVVNSGYSYCVYILDLKNAGAKRREKILRFTVEDYIKDLDEVFNFTCNTFDNITDAEIEEPDETKKIKTSWGQCYDIEQMMEHAIVHILRHRRQIEKFTKILTS